ncbi:MAG: alkaline phosphatase family protein, partial [Verrucomicrobium sp.]
MKFKFKSLPLSLPLITGVGALAVALSFSVSHDVAGQEAAPAAPAPVAPAAAPVQVKSSVARPKLVVGIAVDQMRWDFLYRYQDRYTEDGGFKRLLKDGFTCENGMIGHLPSYTAVGH